MNESEIMHGDRVMVFDHLLFKDDVETPISFTVRPATVICRYGKKSRYEGYVYPDLVDVRFDHRPETVSKGHFTSGVKKINESDTRKD